MKYQVLINGEVYEVEVDDGQAKSDVQVVAAPASSAIQSVVMPNVSPLTAVGEDGFDETKVCRSPVAGIVAKIAASKGQLLGKGELIMVLEAMKMETNITAPLAVRVKDIPVEAGVAVKLRQVLVEFE